MQLTIIQTGAVPLPLRQRFAPYPEMFERMFDATGQGFTYAVSPVFEGAPFPDPYLLEGIVITGSAAAVYEEHDWLPPLRAFIREAYTAGTPMLGICFGHQIMADALGGDVRKSEKGWGIGRHTYDVVARPELSGRGESVSVACSHQDQVIVPPSGAEVILSSPFTPNAGLLYGNGRAVSYQAHPEFADDYAIALAELRRGKAPDAVVEEALASMAKPSDSAELAGSIAAFLTRT